MLKKGNRLYKREKLCATTDIDALFAAGRRSVASSGDHVFSALSYPWRAVWKENHRRSADNAQFLVSVPKKRLRHAVDRVLMRRRCREAYRQNRPDGALTVSVDIAFIYIADKPSSYERTERSIRRILGKIFPQPSPASDVADDNQTD
ncbi:MAG: ribonuclease P protein component [Paramuribaculum sp.]|nr:ribonuclease P protein component [Paramuribaculum sp.]